MTYTVHYPSGKVFTVNGDFRRVPQGDYLLPMILTDDGPAMVLDQRAIVIADGVEVYNPHINRDGLMPLIEADVKAKGYLEP